MRRCLGLLIAGLLSVLAACSNGPDQDALQTELAQRLNQTFGENAIVITHLQRRGSARDSQSGVGEERRVVYFSVDLQVARDMDFSSWDSPGVASLISILGAGPRGLSGIESGGSVHGDQISAHGSMIFQQRGDHWELVVPQGYSPPRAPTLSEGAPLPPVEQLVAAISTSLNLSPSGTSVAARRIINEELTHSLNNIRGRLSRLEQGYPLASGSEHGQYVRFAKAFQTLAKADGVNIQPLITLGGLENLRLLRDGDAVLALSQSDLAQQAYAGSGPFSRSGPDAHLRALASLFPEPLHVLVTAKSGITRFIDLRGKRVNLGQPGSASRETALAVLAAHGLSLNDLQSAGELDLAAALVALRDGQMDAVLQVIGAPADQLRAASEVLDLRLLPLESAAVERVQQERPGIFAFTLPAATYARQTAPVATIAASALLLAEAGLTDQEADLLVHQLFQPHHPWLEQGSIQGAQLSVENALRGLGIPVHPGAERAVLSLRKPSD